MTTENNKNIAEFLGANFKYDLFEMYGIIEIIEDNPYTKHFYQPEEMLFNSDWNWLMEVVENIENIKFKLPSQEYGQYKAMKIKDTLTMKYKESTKKEAVYNACVEFIKWYNEQKKD